MKNLQFLFITFLAIVITSCQFTEELTINKDGSGNYNLNVDMGGMMSSMSGMKENDSIKTEPEKVDTIINMKDVLEMKKDSISKLSASDKEIINAVKDMKMRVRIDEEKDMMLMDFTLDFNNISDLDDIRRKIEKAQQIQDNKGEDKEPLENHEVQYSFKKKKFERKVIMKDLTPEEQELFEKNQEEYNMFLVGSKYKLIYNFPRKIKTVNYPDVAYKNNRKTMIIEVEMDDILKNPQLLDLKVTF